MRTTTTQDSRTHATRARAADETHVASCPQCHHAAHPTDTRVRRHPRRVTEPAIERVLSTLRREGLVDVTVWRERGRTHVRFHGEREPRVAFEFE